MPEYRIQLVWEVLARAGVSPAWAAVLIARQGVVVTAAEAAAQIALAATRNDLCLNPVTVPFREEV